MIRTNTDLVMLLPGIMGGGAERVSLNLAKYLSRRGFVLTIISFNSRPVYLPDLDIEVLFLEKNGFLRNVFKFLLIINKIKPRFIFSTFSYVNIILILLQPFLLPKIICREANLHRESDVKGWKNRAIYRLLFLYNFSDILLCSSHFMKKYFIRKHGVRERKIMVWRNPVDIESLRGLAAMPFSDRRILTGLGNSFSRQFVAIGRLEPQKNFEQLIDWFVGGSRPNDTLLIVGSGSQMAPLEARINALAVGCRIKLCGEQKNPYAIINESDALLLPSLWEGMPNVALEAIALGVPVLAMQTAGAISELASECQLIVVARDASDFVTKLVSLDWGSMRSPIDQLPSEYRLANSGEVFAQLIAQS